MTNFDPQNANQPSLPQQPRPPARKAPRLFDAQNATGSLLLISGSLALGLTTFWLGTGNASTTASAAATSSVTTQDISPTPTMDAQWQDEYASQRHNDDEHDGEYEDGYGYAAPQTYVPQQNYSVQPGFSQQPMGSPRGSSRGS